MVICQHHHELQPLVDIQDNVDWTSSSQFYDNLAEMPSFISSHRQTAVLTPLNTNADSTTLQGKQLHIYNTILQHLETDNPQPIHMIISGTAGTGKSYLINCLKHLLQDQLRVCAPTGVASYNIQGCTLHSLFSLPTKGDFKELEGQKLHNIQQSLAVMKYLIIDEMSMIGRQTFGQIDRRLRQIFPHRRHQMLGGCSCLLFGDFGQLPPVMDLPLYTVVSRNEISDLGSTVYHSFDKAVTLDQIIRQSGQDPDQILFRNILLRLRDGKTTMCDWQELMKHTPSQLDDISEFTTAVRLFPTVQSVAEFNITQLQDINKPIATIKAVHTGHNASKASSEDAGGLDPIIHLAHMARVMLISNLWIEAGLVNGAVGTIISICYEHGGPPDLPLCVMVKFDHYNGPTLPDGSIPISPIRRTWSNSGTTCSRLQLPLKLAWAITIHKAQGLTLDKVVIDIGNKEFSSGLTFVACSRVRRLNDILFTTPFPYTRLSNLSKSVRLQERLDEDSRLLSLNLLPTQSPTSESLMTPSPPIPVQDAALLRTPSPTTELEVLMTPSPPIPVQDTDQLNTFTT